MKNINGRHIAIFVEKLYGGGVEKIFQVICRNFDYEKYDVTVYASRYQVMPKDTYPSNLNIKYYFDSFPNKSTGIHNFLNKVINKVKLFVYYHKTPRTFYNLFIHRKYDVGIAFIEGYATRIVSGAPEGMKKIAWVHTDMMDNHWTTVAFRSDNEERFVYQCFDEVVSVSQKAEKIVRSLFDIRNITVLHNPIDTQAVIQKSVAWHVERQKDVIRIVSLGWLIKVKGYDRLLRVFKVLKEEGNPIELIILGEGNLRDDFEEYIRMNNLQGCVKLMGFVDNPYPYLKSADIYVCSSYAEGFNTSITEALILGRAIVATDISGVREQLGENSEYGIITENSEAGLYGGLKKMLTGNNIHYYQQQSKERQGFFNLESQMLKIYNLIER